MNSLERSGALVTVLSKNQSDIFKNTTVEHVVGDFANIDVIDELVAKNDVVIHLVSSTTPGDSNNDPEKDVLENLVPSIHLINLMSKLGNKKLIYISSGGAVYGNSVESPIRENSDAWPISSYGITKMAIEKHIFMHVAKGDLDARIIRASNPYGPFQSGANNQGVIANFIRKSLRHEKIMVWGDGTVVRDYIYVDDLVLAILKLVDYSGSELIFNIGSGLPTSINDLLNQLELEMGLKLEVEFTPSRDVDVHSNVLDITKAKGEINWEPTIKLSQGLKRTINWWKSQLAS